MNTYKLMIKYGTREKKWQTWALIETWIMVDDIKGWTGKYGATQTMLQKLNQINDKCFNGKGVTTIASRKRYNTTSWVINEDETKMYRLEIVKA